MISELQKHGVHEVQIGNDTITLPDIRNYSQVKLRKRGGGKITVKLGDKIRWHMVDTDNTEWSEEGIVKLISQDDADIPGYSLLIEDHTGEHCSLSEANDWYREFEIIS